jgi:hypothetical protein
VRAHSTTLNGFLAFADYAWDRLNSAGLQLSWPSCPSRAHRNAAEYTLYFTHSFSEFHRVRVELLGFRSRRRRGLRALALQYTGYRRRARTRHEW